MSKRDIIIFLFKWKYSLLGYFIFVVVLSTFLVYVIPQKYEAKATVLVESNRAPVMRSDVAYGAEQISVLNSEIMIIRSRTVIASTVDSIGFAEQEETEPPDTIEQMFIDLGDWMRQVGLREETSPREKLIETIEDDLKVEPLPNSSVIAISLKSNNPERAAEVVNAITDSYIQHHLKIFSSEGTSEVYRKQLERLEAKLLSRKKTLADYKRKNNVSALNETMSALVRQQVSLTADLSETQRELTELRTLYEEGHTKIELAEAKAESIQKQLDDTRTKLQELELQEEYIRTMELGIDSMEKTYNEYQKRYEEELLSALANPDVVNVRIIEYASVPERPNHSRLFYIVLAAAGGMILTFAIAFIKEYFDHRIYSPDVVAELLGVPALGSIEKV